MKHLSAKIVGLAYAQQRSIQKVSALKYEVGKSPLRYRQISKRLTLCDTGVTETPEKWDTYFTEQDPCVVGFLDFHERGKDYYYIDFLSTRSDLGGKGYASRLIDEFFKRLAVSGGYINFGMMARKEIGHLKDKMAKKYPEVKVVGARDWD